MSLTGLNKKVTLQCDNTNQGGFQESCDDNIEIENSLQEQEIENDSSFQNASEGWANAIAKILNTTKPKNKKAIALCRAKKHSVRDVNEKAENYGFEIDGASEEKPNFIELKENSQKREIKDQKVDLRVKPSWRDIHKERTLRKTATRGVVQLFNVVRLQQKDLQHKLQEASSIDSRREAVIYNINKRKFLDVLMNNKVSKSEIIHNPGENENNLNGDGSSDDDDNSDSKKHFGWGVLQNDFLTNKKNKYWDESDGSDCNSSISSSNTKYNDADD